MATDARINTIEDMELLYYSREGQQLLKSNDLLSPFINKADAPVLTTTTGVYNAVYGLQGWIQLNMEANVFGLLPKFPHLRSGWRAITARSATLPYGGRGENASLPETVKPTFAELSTKPKISAVTFENSEVQEYLVSQGGDDAFASMADLRAYFATEHKEDLNAQLNVQNGTLASNNWESMDRVVSSFSEINSCKENDESTSYTANDVDIYSQDRDAAASWADAYVNHNSSTVQSLTDSIIQSVQQNTLTNGANYEGQVWFTGYDTWSVINQLYDSQVRYNIIGKASVQPGVNGIKTTPGQGVGTQVATIFDKPLIQSKDTVQDTGGVSRLYLVDPSNPEGYDYPRLFLRIAKPTQYFEAGINQGTPFAVDKFGTQGMYRTMGELICSFFGAQGKARDLKQ